ncbi:hypothetical protein [uncultured Roseobacter sp.]|uniref:hypothetical protein n=1 Tax=uncultured Roseobacter sp. TaxID=114847 RepID=UPI002603065C|nr:hypothetical protein [uncultured Roseobacter sp.]
MGLHVNSEERISEVIQRVSAYLDRLAGQVFEVESTIGRAVEEQKASDSHTIKNLQALDFLRQSLEDLALMTLLLSRQERPHLGPVELQKVRAGLKLKATQSLLHGEDHPHFGDTNEADSDLDLF